MRSRHRQAERERQKDTGTKTERYGWGRGAGERPVNFQPLNSQRAMSKLVGPAYSPVEVWTVPPPGRCPSPEGPSLLDIQLGVCSCHYSGKLHQNKKKKSLRLCPSRQGLRTDTDQLTPPQAQVRPVPALSLEPGKSQGKENSRRGRGSVGTGTRQAGFKF